MLLSFTLMGIAIVLLAATPSFAVIGYAAPAVVVIARLMQGLAVGGGVGPTTAFLLEIAPEERRGFYTALQYTTQGVSTLLGGLVGVALSSILDPGNLDAYGWRIAFLLGSVILPISFIIRRSQIASHRCHRVRPVVGALVATQGSRRSASQGMP